MKEVKAEVAKTYTTPAGADHLKVTHEWGDVMYQNEASTTVTFTPDSIGVLKFEWIDFDSGDVIKKEFYSSYVPVLVAADYFAENEEMESYEDSFVKIERLLRHVIQNYTGQKFGPYVNKSMEVQGDGGDSLVLPVNVRSLTEVENNFGDSIIELVEVSPNYSNILQRNSRFRGPHYYEIKRDIMWESQNLFDDRYIFTVTGDWGHEYVPMEVGEAAGQLMNDFLAGDEISDLRRKGVFETQLGDFSVRLNADQWGTTGSIMADNLLAPYVNLGIGLV